VNDLTGRLSEAEYELCDKKDVIKLNRSRIEEADKQIQVLQVEKVSCTTTRQPSFAEANLCRPNMLSPPF
jgi:hypothetical protein